MFIRCKWYFAVKYSFRKGKINIRQCICSISYNERWQDLHWQSFISAYRRSPFFEYYEEEFRKLYTTKFEFLVDFNFQMMQLIAKILKKTELSVTFADKYYPESLHLMEMIVVILFYTRNCKLCQRNLPFAGV